MPMYEDERVHILCDFDGTLTCPSHKKLDESWEEFFARAKPNEPMIKFVRNMLGLYHVAIVTSRMAKHEDLTRGQLERWGMGPETLEARGLNQDKIRFHFRADDDGKSSVEVKLDICKQNNYRPVNTLFVMEDDLRVIEAFLANGFDVMRIVDGQCYGAGGLESQTKSELRNK